MKSNVFKIGLMIISLGLINGVQAQDKKNKSPEKKFEKIDKNKDTKIDLEEFNAYIQKKKAKGKAEKVNSAKKFKKMDLDKNGFIDFVEYKAHKNKPRKGKKVKMTN